jgi:hypothetical protein
MIKAAIVGLGWWGKNIADAVQGKSSKLQFVHGVTQELDATRDFAKSKGFRLSATLEEALADPEVQAIVLATPHSLHADQVVQVARAGKAVFCEKPLAKPPECPSASARTNVSGPLPSKCVASSPAACWDASCMSKVTTPTNIRASFLHPGAICRRRHRAQA